MYHNFSLSLLFEDDSTHRKMQCEIHEKMRLVRRRQRDMFIGDDQKIGARQSWVRRGETQQRERDGVLSDLVQNGFLTTEPSQMGTQKNQTGKKHNRERQRPGANSRVIAQHACICDEHLWEVTYVC